MRLVEFIKNIEYLNFVVVTRNKHCEDFLKFVLDILKAFNREVCYEFEQQQVGSRRLEAA